MTREEEFLAHLPVIERVIRRVCVIHCLHGADAEDFKSVAMIRLIENDYAVLAKFEGRSSFGSYIRTVVTHMYLDFQNQRFGKWRPSAAARRLGPIALRLECLLYRDGLTLDEACGVLGSDPRVSVSRRELEELSGRLPQRSRSGPECSEPVEASDPSTASDELAREERQALAERTFAVIRRVLARLPARERVILRLHFGDGMQFSDISKSLGVPQMGLYRMKDKTLKKLRVELEAEGIARGDVQELLDNLDWDAAFVREESVESGRKGAEPRPSPPLTDDERPGGEA